MREREFLDKVKVLGLGIFTPSDASKILGISGSGLNIFLHRLSERGAITRIEKGKYHLSDMPEEVIATGIVVPSYISFLWALSFHKLSTQMPSMISVVTLRRHTPVVLARSKVRFMVIRKERFFGMVKHRASIGEEFTLADPEKALIDSLCYPDHCPISETIESLRTAVGDDMLDLDRLAGYTARMGSHAAAKRLGFLLSENGIDMDKVLGRFVNSKYDPLDPSMPLKGKFSARWRLIINTEV